jgi:glycosyltransferase involved in cell wall biosynthesis
MEPVTATRPTTRTPAVSVIVAAYQAAAFVGDAIASALDQTMPDIEVIVVDDGSTDGTWEVLSRAAAQDARVVPVRHAQQSGPAAARNTALAQARGEWIAVLDSDDLFMPDRLERMVSQAESLSADLLADNLLFRDFATRADLGLVFPSRLMADAGPISQLEMLRRDVPGTPGYTKFGFLKPIMRHSFLRRTGIRYHPDIFSAEDLLLYFECAGQGGRFHLVTEAGYVYHRRHGSVVSSRRANLHATRGNQRMMALVPPHAADLRAELARRQQVLEFECFRFMLEQRQIGTCLNHLSRVPPGYLIRRMAKAVMRRIRHRSVAFNLPSHPTG